MGLRSIPKRWSDESPCHLRSESVHFSDDSDFVLRSETSVTDERLGLVIM